MPGAFAGIVNPVLGKFNRKPMKRAFMHAGNETLNHLAGQKFERAKAPRDLRINFFNQKPKI